MLGERLPRSRWPSLHPIEVARGLERYVGDELEGRLRRWLRAPLQPVEIAKAAARAMEASQAIGPSGLQVANCFEVHLHPDDFQRFASFRLALARQLEAYLEDQATRLGARPVDAWQVSLVADERLRPGRVRVKGEMADVGAAAGLPTDQTGPPLDSTQRVSAVVPSAPAPRGVLVVGEVEYPLVRPVTSVGRALDNDVVLSDSRVSRYHVQLHEEAGRYRLSDLASTNGTFIAGRRITEAVLAPGDEVSLGGLVVRLQVRS
ncbi:MAG: DUF3662 domain-containing protein [Chloroflexi bacterium]|nr:DUF3662 domain-containing protein [Chloroflexota bacterium]